MVGLKDVWVFRAGTTHCGALGFWVKGLRELLAVGERAVGLSVTGGKKLVLDQEQEKCDGPGVWPLGD